MLRLILYIYSQLFDLRLPKLRAYIYVSSFGFTLQWFWPELVFFQYCFMFVYHSCEHICIAYLLFDVTIVTTAILFHVMFPLLAFKMYFFCVCLSSIVTSIFLFLLSIYCFTSQCLRPELVYPYIVLRRPTIVSIRKYFLLSV